MGFARLAAAVAVAASMTLVACGGDSSDGTEPRPPAATAAEQPGSGGNGLKLEKVGDFESPVYVTSPPGDASRLMVVEQGGRIVLLKDGEEAGTFLDISSEVTAGGEQGLLSVAFAPDYAQSKRLYVYFTDKQQQQRVVEYTASSDDEADPSSARLVLKMADDEPNHNGGLLLFGPDDLLYIGTGDGGGAGDQHGELGNGQDTDSLLGKLLRIDPRPDGQKPYGIPDDNPFVDGGGAPEVYSYGLRNPWRYSFDRETGDLTIGDVGQEEYEEIDFVREGDGNGANFGWRPFEGTARYAEGEDAPGHVPPVIVQSHADDNCSITGGVVARDPDVPGAEGKYLFGDFCKGEVYSAELDLPKARNVRGTGLEVPSLASFGEDADGRVYMVSIVGPVYRLAAGA